MPALPDVLRSRRESAGLSQTELAYHIDRSTYTVVAYERGTVEPPLSVLRRIAEVLDVDLGQLLDGSVVR